MGTGLHHYFNFVHFLFAKEFCSPQRKDGTCAARAKLLPAEQNKEKNLNQVPGHRYLFRYCIDGVNLKQQQKEKAC